VNPYQRIFGSGPFGTLLSVLLLAPSVWLASRFDHLQITPHDGLRFVAFSVLSLTTLLIIVWSVRSLPPAERGNTLVTGGAFKYFRHPLYGAFLSFFNFGLALLLNNWIYVLWAAVQHPVWHLLIRGEERLMKQAFPGQYDQYAAVTGRFFPRLWAR
jgi:protein-S-isoprenylcysteine O-methyltransferase Ste14